MDEGFQPPATPPERKSGLGSLVWSMTGGLLSRLTGSREGGSSKKDGARSRASVRPGGPRPRNPFWRKRTRLPGTVKQVRGAQYPPLTGDGQVPVMLEPAKLRSQSSAGSADTGLSGGGSTRAGGAGGTAVGAPRPPPGHPPTVASGAGVVAVDGSVVAERNGGADSKSSALGESSGDSKRPAEPKAAESSNALSKRAAIFKLINKDNLDVEALRKHTWSGLCPAVRSDVWQLVLGYQPASRSRRLPTIAKRRAEYAEHVRQHFYEDDKKYTAEDMKVLHQIRLDAPRTLPAQRLLQHASLQRLLERILYIWSIRHPASGYVQGINDLVVPFLMVFLSARAGVQFDKLEEKHLAGKHLGEVEADCFWCLSKLLDGIQDHYTSSQPGIQKMVFKLEELVHRLNKPLHTHLKKHGIRFFHFSYRWMNCLLMREMSLSLIIRIWDTYIAEPNGFKVFHVYVCAALLVRFSDELCALEEFQDLIVFLQNVPTQKWTEKDVETLLAQAYVYKYQFEGAEHHLA